MKYRATRKDVLRWYDCFQVGYCDLQDLLFFEAPRYYTCGVYGWNADVYAFGDNAIVTGYRPFGRKADSKLVRAYNDLAKTICHEYRYTWEEKEDLLNLLIDEFLEVLTA
jgi:hypothetical protein